MIDAYLRSYVEDLRWTLQEVNPRVVDDIVGVLQRARQADAQILVIGNGGSAATSSHLACDLAKGTIDYTDPSFRRFRAISLADNNALMTAVGNDLSFDEVFVEQLRIVLRPGDVVIAISASGNSPNLVRALEFARLTGATTIGLLGFGGGRMRDLSDYALVVSSRNYGIAEDFHLIIQHVVTQYLRRAVAGPPRPVVFLDRDGIINERPAPHTYVENWTQFRFVAGVLPALRALVEQGLALIVVTNQQGVGKGIVSPEALREAHDQMRLAMAEAGAPLSGLFVCPHLEDDHCFCRKPRPGLIFRAVNETSFGIDLDRSVLLGDSETDVLAGHAAGLRTVLLHNGTGCQPSVATQVAASIAEATTAAARLALRGA